MGQEEEEAAEERRGRLRATHAAKPGRRPCQTWRDAKPGGAADGEASMPAVAGGS